MPTTYAIPNGRTVMDATLYTGTGSTQDVVNAGGFKPDLVWTKSRSNAISHHLTDSVRGVNKALYSNATLAEATYTSDLNAFNSNGFNVGNDGSQSTSTYTYVGWQWQAGGTAVSNTSGTITSSVSANTTAGFSIVTCTSPSSAGAFTFGHGLGVAPQFIISKSRNTVGNWSNYHVSTGAGGYLLFTTAAYTANTDTWNNTTPTSSLISSTTNWWGTSSTLVFYCWTPIAGYSAFGSYTGNGSNDGPFVYTGFRPKFLMFKRTDTTGDWGMYDTSRDPYNLSYHLLRANTSAVEDTGNVPLVTMDLLSNGIKFRGTWSDMNASGGTYIYMAFAENPFKYSNAR